VQEVEADLSPLVVEQNRRVDPLRVGEVGSVGDNRADVAVGQARPHGFPTQEYVLGRRQGHFPIDLDPEAVQPLGTVVVGVDLLDVDHLVKVDVPERAQDQGGLAGIVLDPEVVQIHPGVGNVVLGLRAGQAPGDGGDPGEGIGQAGWCDTPVLVDGVVTLTSVGRELDSCVNILGKPDARPQQGAGGEHGSVGERATRAPVGHTEDSKDEGVHGHPGRC